MFSSCTLTFDPRRIYHNYYNKIRLRFPCAHFDSRSGPKKTTKVLMHDPSTRIQQAWNGVIERRQRRSSELSVTGAWLHPPQANNSPASGSGVSISPVDTDELFRVIRGKQDLDRNACPRDESSARDPAAGKGRRRIFDLESNWKSNRRPCATGATPRELGVRAARYLESTLCPSNGAPRVVQVPPRDPRDIRFNDLRPGWIESPGPGFRGLAESFRRYPADTGRSDESPSQDAPSED